MKKLWTRRGAGAACSEMRGEVLSRLIDGELPPEDSRAAHEHLGACAGCRVRHAEMQFARTTINRLASFDDGFVPAPRGWRVPADEAAPWVADAKIARETGSWRAATIALTTLAAATLSPLHSFATRRVAVPLPLLVILVVGAASMIVLSRSGVPPVVSEIRNEEQGRAASPARIEVPVEVEKPVVVERVVERVVTRTRFVERAAGARVASRTAIVASPPAADATRERVRRSEPDAPRIAEAAGDTAGVAGALAGFEPVRAVKVTLITDADKEPRR